MRIWDDQLNNNTGNILLENSSMSEERDNGISKAPRTMTTHQEMPETSGLELLEAVITPGSKVRKGLKK